MGVKESKHKHIHAYMQAHTILDRFSHHVSSYFKIIVAHCVCVCVCVCVCMCDQNDWYLISVAFLKSYLSVHGGDYKSDESR